MPRYCSVPKCLNKTSRFCIPANKQVQEIWLRRIGNEAFSGITSLRHKLVCKAHFHPTCIEASGKLHKFALPTLNLPGYTPCPEHTDILLTMGSQSVPNLLEDSKDSIELVEFTAGEVVPDLKVLTPRKNFGKKRQPKTEWEDLDAPSTSRRRLEVEFPSNFDYEGVMQDFEIGLSIDYDDMMKDSRVSLITPRKVPSVKTPERGCACSTNCSTKMCGCRKTGLSCSNSCKCTRCTNQREENGDQFSD